MAKAGAKSRDKEWHEAYAKLTRVLTAKTKNPNLEPALKKIATTLAKSKRHIGPVQIAVGGGGKREQWTLDLMKDDCSLRTGASYKPRFEVVARRSALNGILAGDRSPIAELAAGNLRVRGDIEFGKEIYRLLSNGKGRIDPCP